MDPSDLCCFFLICDGSVCSELFFFFKSVMVLCDLRWLFLICDGFVICAGSF